MNKKEQLLHKFEQKLAQIGTKPAHLDQGKDKRRAIFIAEYVKSKNATKSAIAAGYSAKSAASQGNRLLKDAKVQKLIDEELAKISKKALVDAEFVILGLKQVAERTMQAVPVMVYNAQTKQMEQEIDEEGRAVWKFDSTGANKAYELLGKHLKLFSDKLDITGEFKNVSTEDLENEAKTILSELKNAENTKLN